MRVLFCVLALLPLAVNFFADLPYEPVKIGIFEVSVTLALGISLAAILLRRRETQRRLSGLRLHALDWCVLGLFGALALSTIFSLNPAASFVGSEERGTGLWYYWNLLLMYFLLRIWATSAGWKIFLRLSCIVVLLVSAYGIMQWLGWDLPGLKGAFPLYGRSGPTRVFATLGHPNFLGTYLAMFVPLGIWSWRSDPRRAWRLLAAA